MKEKKIYFTIEEMELALDEIINQISQTEWFPELIISINRGGCVPGVYLSHAINVPHKVIDVQLRDEKNKLNLAILENSLIYYSNILIIDDINDTGATFKLIDHAIDKKEINIYFASLIENNSSAFKVDFRGKVIDKSLNPSWIVFPW
ncbi:phosphoribosyltransferase domain-containing protein [Flavobacteriaceae bacterium]|nr:phosphoribosyltransferase domain-containing protein [Flavobacteriaceae bacterium]